MTINIKPLEKEEVEEPQLNLEIIFCVAQDGRTTIVDYHSHPAIDDDIKIMNDELELADKPGLYKGSLEWDSCIHWESQIDEGFWQIAPECELLYLIDINKE